MLEELHRRNFADTTVRTYLHGVAHFSQYFRRPPDQLGPEDIRKYQANRNGLIAQAMVRMLGKSSQHRRVRPASSIGLQPKPGCVVVNLPDSN
jgi:hypothetical protein